MSLTKFVILLLYWAFIGPFPQFAISATQDQLNPTPSDKNNSAYYKNLRLIEDLENPSSLVFTMGYNPSIGGDVSGGGSILRLGNQPEFLLDFATIAPDFKETREILTTQESLFTEKLTPENILNGIPFSIKTKAPKSYQLLEERLKLWEKNSPITCNAIRRILLKTSLRATVLGIERLKEYELSNDFSDSQRKITTISLVLKSFGIFINNQIWVRPLGLTSRAGLFAHEALRSIRIEISDRLENKTIQLITAHLMLTNPTSFKSGFLDELFIRDLWSEKIDISNLKIDLKKSDYFQAACERKDIIYQLSQQIEDSAYLPLGWNDEVAYSYLVRLDNKIRQQSPESIKSALHGISKIELYSSLEEIPQRTFSYWLDHITNVQRFYNQKIFSLELIPLTPAFQFKKDAALLTRPFWSVLRKHLESLKDKACVNGADKSIVTDFIFAARTVLGRIANEVSINEEDNYFRNLNSNEFPINSIDKTINSKFIESVIEDAMGVRNCNSTYFKKKILVVGKSNIPGITTQCTPIPIKYFINGIPHLPRINSK